ncbi:MAG: right-handed parallel beta-helix repeat-containing protein [Cytophagales bacterium]|nr:right-handed parallel beta-helix repeat-containing protein [Cytophagales bacterium]
MCNLTANSISPRTYNGVSNITISGLRITNASGPCIILNNCSNVRIENCILGPSLDEGVRIYGSTNVTITNCSFESNSSGVYALQSTGIRVNYNQFSNVQGPFPRGQFVQFDKVSVHPTNPVASEIKFNVGEITCREGNPEDLISIYSSNGTAAYPILVKGNKLRGGGPSISGGGIMAGDGGGSYTVIEDNLVVNPGNYGIAISGGFNNTIRNNQIYARYQCHNGWQLNCGGTEPKILGFCGDVGIYVNNFAGSPYCGGHVVQQNKVKWYRVFDNTRPEDQNPRDAGGSCGFITGWDAAWASGGNDWSAPIDHTILPADLVCPDVTAHFRFTNNLFDASGSNLNASGVGGGPAYVCDGNFRSGDFDGVDDHVSVPKSVWLRPGADRISFGAWIKPDVSNRLMTIAHSQDGDGWADGWRMMMNNGNLNVRLVTQGGTRDLYFGGVVGQQWNYVAFTYSGAELKVYVNGALAGSSALTGSIVYNAVAHSSDNMRIGFSDGQNYFFDGKIDDVKFYKGVLSPSAVTAEYNNNKGFYNNTVSDLPPIEGSYYTNGQTRTLGQGNAISGTATVTASYPIAATYTWQIQSGSPSYWFPSGSSLDFSLNVNTSVNVMVTVNTACGSTSRSLVFFNSGTAVAAAYSVYPNPSSGSLTIEQGAADAALALPATDGAAFDAKLYDKFQRVVRVGKAAKGKLQMNVKGLPEGFYYLHLQSGRAETVVRQVLIKQ